MMTTSSRPTTYPPLPAFTPRVDGEDAHTFGVRAFTFALETGITATLPLEALELADHVYPSILHRQLSGTAAERLAEVRRRIQGALRVCAQATAQSGPQAAPAPVQAPKGPQGGAKVARRPSPKPQAPVAPAAPVPVPQLAQLVADPF